MPVVNFPEDKPAVDALYRDKNIWNEARKLLNTKNGEREAALEAIEAEYGAAFRLEVRERAQGKQEERKLIDRLRLEQSSKRMQNINNLKEELV